MEKNYISIDRISMDKAQTDELIETLSFLQLQVLATLKNDTGDGLIKDLSKLLNETKVIKNEISTSEKSVSNNLEILKKILEKIELSESSSEMRLINTNDQFQKEIIKIKDELVEDFKKKVEEINEKIDERINNINLKTLEAASNNTTTAINRLNTFYTVTKDINNNLQSKLKITNLILSFISGGALVSLFLYFFN
jgi:hypothetical protein